MSRERAERVSVASFNGTFRILIVHSFQARGTQLDVEQVHTGHSETTVGPRVLGARHRLLHSGGSVQTRGREASRRSAEEELGAAGQVADAIGTLRRGPGER